MAGSKIPGRRRHGRAINRRLVLWRRYAEEISRLTKIGQTWRLSRARHRSLPRLPWRASPPRALLSPLARDESAANRIRLDDVGLVGTLGGAGEPRDHRGSAGRYDLGELAAVEEDHLRAQPAAVGDPFAQLRGIHVQHRLAGDGLFTRLPPVIGRQAE